MEDPPNQIAPQARLFKTRCVGLRGDRGDHRRYEADAMGSNVVGTIPCRIRDSTYERIDCALIESAVACKQKLG